MDHRMAKPIRPNHSFAAPHSDRAFSQLPIQRQKQVHGPTIPTHLNLPMVIQFPSYPSRKSPGCGIASCCMPREPIVVNLRAGLQSGLTGIGRRCIGPPEGGSGLVQSHRHGDGESRLPLHASNVLPNRTMHPQPKAHIPIGSYSDLVRDMNPFSRPSRSEIPARDAHAPTRRGTKRDLSFISFSSLGLFPSKPALR